jgi:hypothetical protein
MTTKRKTSVDYRKEYEETVVTQKRIKNYLTGRVRSMSQKYPNARVLEGMKAQELLNDRDWEMSFDIPTLLFVLDRLERFSASQQKIEQLYLTMPDEMRETLKKLND